jgi:F-type H+-transporting ATPase subunit delta
MAEFDYTSVPIADSYATALLELAEQAGAAENVLAEMQAFVQLMRQDEGFGGFMSSLAVDPDERQAALEKLRGRLSDLLLNTLQVINRKGRCPLIPLIAARLRLQLEDLRHEVDVRVTSAVDLTDELRTRLAKAVGRLVGLTPRLIETVDPAIGGGLIVRIGDDKRDGSLTGRLARLRATLIDRIALEIHSGRQYIDAAAT